MATRISWYCDGTNCSNRIHTTYSLAPNSYRPVELTTKGTSDGSILRFETYQTLPVKENSKLLEVR